jgi:hypothetical protein
MTTFVLFGATDVLANSRSASSEDIPGRDGRRWRRLG